MIEALEHILERNSLKELRILKATCRILKEERPDDEADHWNERAKLYEQAIEIKEYCDIQGIPTRIYNPTIGNLVEEMNNLKGGFSYLLKKNNSERSKQRNDNKLTLE